jgi:hypothetical protein
MLDDLGKTVRDMQSYAQPIQASDALRKGALKMRTEERCAGHRKPERREAIKEISMARVRWASVNPIPMGDKLTR